MLLSVIRRMSHRRLGAVVVLAAILLVALFAFVAFTVDVGYISMSKAQLQNATDAAALAAAQVLDDGPDAARAAAKQVALANSVAGTPLELTDSDIEFGTWDDETGAFTVLPAADEDEANSVRVSGRLIGSRGTQLNLFFAPVIGHDDAELVSSAIGLPGGGEPRDLMLVIDTSKSMEDYSRMVYTRGAAQTLVNEATVKDRVGLTIFSYPTLVYVANTVNDSLYSVYGYYGHHHDDDDDDDDDDDGGGGSWVTVVTGYLEEGMSYDHSGTESRIPQLTAGMYHDYTDIAGGMRVALEELQNNPRGPDEEEAQQYLILLTDGYANLSESPGTTPSNSITHYRDVAIANNVIIHGITLGSGADQTTIQNVATATGGEYYHIEDGDYTALQEAFRAIAHGSGSRLAQ